MFQDRANAPAPDLYAYKTADETISAVIAMQNDSHLSVSVKAGRKYIFRLVVFVTDTNQQTKFDFAGGTATATNFIAGNETAGTPFVTSLASEILGQSTVADDSYPVTIAGAFEPATDGTFILRWCQTVGLGTATLKRGSSLSLWRLA